MRNNLIVLYGCGGHSRSIADVILFNNKFSKLIFIDENAVENERIFNFPVLKNLSAMQNSYESFIAIGDNYKRMEISNGLLEKELVSVISKRASTGYGAQIKEGCFIGHFSHVGPEAKIGRCTIINTGAIVEHEVMIGDYCHIAPGSAISGRTKIGDLVFIGTGAKIIDSVNICSHVIVGAGSTVIHDIIEPGVYVGSPAKKIK